MASTSKKNRQTSSVKGSGSPSQRSPKPEKVSQPRKPKSSMGLGLLMIAIGTSLVGLGGLGYLFYQELLSGAKREIEQSNTAQTRKIETNLSNIRQSTNAVASAAKVLVQQPAKPRNADPYQGLIAEAVQGNQAIAGMGISQNSLSLFPAPKTTVPYVWNSKAGLKPEVAGQKLPAPYDQFLASNRPDIVNSDYYKSALKGQAGWSEPYNSLGQSLITYSAPIKDGQKILGVVNADAIAKELLALEDATSKDSANKIGFVILNASGKVVTASEQFQAMQAQNSGTPDAIAEITKKAQTQAIGIAQVGGNLWSYRKIDGSDWLVATYLPESEITSKLLMFVGGAALGISTILAIAILGFVNSLKKRLQPITEECNLFLAQHSNVNAPTLGKDEIDNLSISIKNTLQRAKVEESRYRNEVKPAIDVEPVSLVTQPNAAETDLMEAEVGDLLDVVSSMEEGDLTIEAQVNDRATGLVADTLNRLREKLIEIISSVLGTAQQVAKGAADLEELARTVVLNTAEQAESVAQGQALTEQVATIAQRSADQISVANQSLQEVRETVASGQTAIETLTTSISVLQTGSAQIVQRMKTLGEFVGLAEQFVQDQGQIASLTQVLALNATLVAARAAEQKDPKQFAGVAREFESIAAQVNDLATQTNDGLTVLQQRTSQIQTVVTAIDAEVQNLSGLVSGFTTGVDESQSAFNSIQAATEEVVQIGEAITISSTEIAEAAGSTASYISEIAQLADRTASLTRSARQQAEAMGNQAQQLLQGIQFFRLPEAAAIASPDNFAAVGADTAKASVNLDDTAGLPDGLSEEPTLGTTIGDTQGDRPDMRLGLAAAVPLTAVAIASQLGGESSQDQSSFFQSEETGVNLDSSAADVDPFDSSPAQFTDTLTDSFEDPFTDDDDYLEEQIDIPDSLSLVDNVEIEPPLEPAELTSISLEESLLNDLRQEIYDESVKIPAFDSDSSETSATTDQAEEINSVFELNDDLNNEFSDGVDFTDDTSNFNTLKNPLEGVNESAIVDPASDPLIASAASAFVEDTVFGTPAPLSEEALANVPQFVDFTIPDLDDDEDFHIPNIPIESTLDNSNSFYAPEPLTAEAEAMDAVGDAPDPFYSGEAIAPNDSYDSYENYEDDSIFESNYLVDSAVAADTDNVFAPDYQSDYQDSVMESSNDYAQSPFEQVIEDNIDDAGVNYDNYDYTQSSFEQVIENNTDDADISLDLNYGSTLETEDVVVPPLPEQIQEEPASVFELDLEEAIADDEFLGEEVDYLPVSLDLEEETQERQEDAAIPDSYLDDSLEELADDDLEFSFNLDTDNLDTEPIALPSEEARDQEAEVDRLFAIAEDVQDPTAQSFDDSLGDPFAIAEAPDLEAETNSFDELNNFAQLDSSTSSLDNFSEPQLADSEIPEFSFDLSELTATEDEPALGLVTDEDNQLPENLDLENPEFDQFNLIPEDLASDSTESIADSQFLQSLESLEPFESFDYSANTTLDALNESTEDTTPFDTFSTFDDDLPINSDISTSDISEADSFDYLGSLEEFTDVPNFTEPPSSPDLTLEESPEDVDISALFAIADEPEEDQEESLGNILENTPEPDLANLPPEATSDDSAIAYQLDIDANSMESDLSEIDLSAVGFDDDFSNNFNNFNDDSDASLTEQSFEDLSEIDLTFSPAEVLENTSTTSEISEMMDMLESPDLLAEPFTEEAFAEEVESANILIDDADINDADDESDDWLEDLEELEESSDAMLTPMDNLDASNQPSYDFANSLLDSLIEETDVDQLDEDALNSINEINIDNSMDFGTIEFSPEFSSDVNPDVNSDANLGENLGVNLDENIDITADLDSLGIVDQDQTDEPISAGFFDLDAPLAEPFVTEPVAETLEDSDELDEESFFNFDFSEISGLGTPTKDLANSSSGSPVEQVLPETETKSLPNIANTVKDAVDSAKNEIDDFLAGNLDIDEISNSINPQSHP